LVSTLDARSFAVAAVERVCSRQNARGVDAQLKWQSPYACAGMRAPLEKLTWVNSLLQHGEILGGVCR
jgi:hypothetical protein